MVFFQYTTYVTDAATRTAHSIRKSTYQMDAIPQLPRLSPKDGTLTKQWQYPQKRIFCGFDIPQFKSSAAIDRINGIISLICTKVSLRNVPSGILDDGLVNFEEHTKDQGHSQRNTENTRILYGNQPPAFEDVAITEKNYSRITVSILDILQYFKELMDSTPPFPGSRRYGNLACRDWHDKLTMNIGHILDERLKELFFAGEDRGDVTLLKNYEGFRNEIKYYILGSFGSRERLDYGTGHELSFISFLGCLVMIGLIDRDEIDGIELLVILSKYYDLVKLLILTYTLEPAGSHGVWGLDDHFHLIYVFGACQLVDFAHIGDDARRIKSRENYSNVMNFRMGLTPSSILNNETLKVQRTRNLYYNAISFIKKVKTGPFNEHSPILYEVSASQNWEKVTKGMLRMYYGEVLSKFPVVQHFYFGGVFYPWLDPHGRLLKSSDGAELDTDNRTVVPDKPVDVVDSATSFNSRYNSEVSETMTANYPHREGELARLLNERRVVGQIGRTGRELPGVRDQGCAGNGGSPVVTTSAPWATGRSLRNGHAGNGKNDHREGAK